MNTIKSDKTSQNFRLMWNNGGRLTLFVLGVITASFITIFYNIVPIIKQERIKNINNYMYDNARCITDNITIVKNIIDKNVISDMNNISNMNTAMNTCLMILNDLDCMCAVSIEYNKDKYNNSDSLMIFACHLSKCDTTFVMGKEYYDTFSYWSKTKSYFEGRPVDQAYLGYNKIFPIINCFCLPISLPYYNDSSDVDFVITAYCKMEKIYREISFNNLGFRGTYMVFNSDSLISSSSIDTLFNKPAYPWLKEQYGENIASRAFSFSNENVEIYSVCDNSIIIGQLYKDQRRYLIDVPTDDLTIDLKKQIKRVFLYCVISTLILLIANYRMVSKNIKKFLQNESDRKDMETAAKIQGSMLSKPYKNASVELCSKLVPAKLIGGDLYYYYQRNDMLYICVGDVSGKGMPAAMFMSKTISLFQFISQTHVEPDIIAEVLNNELVRDNETNMFVTMFIGVLDLKTGILRFCNAGHDEPILWDGDNSHMPKYLHTSVNLPLGVDTGLPFQEGSIKLKAGSVLLLYTDGVTEAMNIKNEQYGEDRLLELFGSKCSETVETINDSLLDDIAAFVGKRSQSDDITILTLKINHTDETVLTN